MPDGSNEDAADSPLIEGKGLFIMYEVLVFAIDSFCFPFLYFIVSGNGNQCMCMCKETGDILV